MALMMAMMAAANAAETPYKLEVTATDKLVTCYVIPDTGEPFPLGAYVYCIQGMVVPLAGTNDDVTKLAQLLLKKLNKPVYLSVSVESWDVVLLFQDIIDHLNKV